MEVAHSGAELAHSDVEVARSDVEVARSDVEVARSDMEVAHSGAELAHSGVEIAHSDCKEEEIIAGNLLEYSSSEASQFICNEQRPTKSESSHTHKVKSLLYSSISTPPRSLVRLIGADYNKDEKDSKDLLKRFGKYGQMFIEDEASLTPSRILNQ